MENTHQKIKEKLDGIVNALNNFQKINESEILDSLIYVRSSLVTHYDQLDLNQREELRFKVEQVNYLYDDIRERERQNTYKRIN